MIGQFTEPISCYNCHENDPSQIKLTHSYWVDSLGNAAESDDKAAPLKPRRAASAAVLLRY